MASEMQMKDIENFDEYRNHCLGQDNCKECSRYMDDCDGEDNG